MLEILFNVSVLVSMPDTRREASAALIPIYFAVTVQDGVNILEARSVKISFPCARKRITALTTAL